MTVTGRKAFRAEPRLAVVVSLLSSKTQAARIVEVHSVTRKPRSIWTRDLDGDYRRLAVGNPKLIDDLEGHLLANRGRPIQVIVYGLPRELDRDVAPKVWGPWAV